MARVRLSVPPEITGCWRLRGRERKERTSRSGSGTTSNTISGQDSGTTSTSVPERPGCSFGGRETMRLSRRAKRRLAVLLVVTVLAGV